MCFRSKRNEWNKKQSPPSLFVFYRFVNNDMLWNHETVSFTTCDWRAVSPGTENWLHESCGTLKCSCGGEEAATSCKAKLWKLGFKFCPLKRSLYPTRMLVKSKHSESSLPVLWSLQVVPPTRQCHEQPWHVDSEPRGGRTLLQKGPGYQPPA